MGRKFIFRLQAVLEQRERDEEQAKRALGVVERERMALEQFLKELQASIGQSRRELREELAPDRGGGVRVTNVRLQAGASLHLAARARQGALELAGVYKRLEAARAALLRAKAARKAVQLLRDRRFAEWKLENRRSEDREADDLGIMKHGRLSPVAEAAA